VLDVIAKYLYSRADRIIVLARGVGSYLVEHGTAAEKIIYIPNGVDPASYTDLGTTNGQRFTAIYAGAHGPANGLSTVIEAADLLRHRADIHVLLVGDGPSKPELREDARRRGLTNVEFLDPVPKHEMPALLARSSAGLMVLRDAPLFAFGVSPNKLFDYFGAQLPVVCNVPGEVAAMVSAADAGEQAADSSAAALAAAIERLANTPRERRTEMGAAGRRWVNEEHNRTRLAARLDAALRPLLTG
jgi:glycosyltransferase involved in cell wall biosynthesis